MSTSDEIKKQLQDDLRKACIEADLDSGVLEDMLKAEKSRMLKPRLNIQEVITQHIEELINFQDEN